MSTNLHGVTLHEAIFFTVTTVETSNNTQNFRRSSIHRPNVVQAITKSMDNIW